TRGSLPENRVHDELRVYDLRMLKGWLKGRDGKSPPSPLTTVRLGTYREGPIITDIRWLPDSSGITFLAKTADGREQIWGSDLGGRPPRALTPPSQDVD